MFIGPGEHGGGDEQVQIVRDLVAKGVDGLAVSPDNASAMASALQDAKGAGIPVVTWDADLPAQNRDLRIAYFGTDDYALGFALGALIEDAKENEHKQGGEICIQVRDVGSDRDANRLWGLRDALNGAVSSFPGTRLSGGNHGWNEIDGCSVQNGGDTASQLSSMLSQHPSLAAFVSLGPSRQWQENSLRNATDSFKSKMQNGDFVFASIGSTGVQMEDLRAGLTVGQAEADPFEMAYRAIRARGDVKAGRALDPSLQKTKPKCSKPCPKSTTAACSLPDVEFTPEKCPCPKQSQNAC
jgi:ribose transport system substrate-binding protein